MTPANLFLLGSFLGLLLGLFVMLCVYRPQIAALERRAAFWANAAGEAQGHLEVSRKEANDLRAELEESDHGDDWKRA